MNKNLDSIEAEDMTKEDWEELAASESGLQKIANKIECFFKLLDTQELYENVVELRESFIKAFKDLEYPKPLDEFKVEVEKGRINFTGSVSSPIDDMPILFAHYEW